MKLVRMVEYKPLRDRLLGETYIASITLINNEIHIINGNGEETEIDITDLLDVD